MNYIILNGVKSNSINGLLIQSLPPISKPLMRTEIIDIDGRDGDIINPLGFAAYDKTFEIGLYGNYNIDEIIAYFDSKGTVTFSNESDKFYNYQIIGQIDFERLIRYRTATVTMHVQPFKYSLVDNLRSYLINNQILNFSDYQDTINGVTVNVANGTIIVSGTASDITEFYIPVPQITLESGNYALTAFAAGNNPESTSVRLIYNNPTFADSFGGTYAALKNNEEVSIYSSIAFEKIYNYIYFSISPGAAIDFSLDLLLENVDIPDFYIRNNGNIISRPEITIYGAGTITLSLNGAQIFVINLGNEGRITIDAAKMDASKDGVLKNRLVQGDYENFALKVGLNSISLTGEVSKIDIKNYSRWV